MECDMSGCVVCIHYVKVSQTNRHSRFYFMRTNNLKIARMRIENRYRGRAANVEILLSHTDAFREGGD